MSTPNSKSLLAIGLLTAVSRAVTVVPDVTSLRSSLQNQQAFLVEMDIAYFKGYSLFLPGCIANSTEYEAALAAANCGACSSSGTADVQDVCCDGLSEWSSSDDACRSYKGEDSLVCCNFCTNVSNVGYSQRCDMSNDGENLVGESVCNVSPLVLDTDPLPAGYDCSTSPDHTVEGTYSENDIDYSMPSCDSFDTALVSYSTLGTAAMEDWTATADAIQMREELGIVYRAQLANGRITFDSTMKCGIITNPIANGALIIEDGENSDMRILNPYVYASSPAAVLNGTRMVVMGGDNNGVMDFNNAATVHLMGIVNSGAVSFQTISDLVVLDVENKAGAMISFINNQARLDAVTNYGDVTVFSGVVNATEIYNHGTILVKSGSKGILELYENTGSVIFEDNVDAEVYAPSTVGITLPSDGSITVTIGKADGTDFDEESSGDDSFCFHVDSTIDYKGIQYSYAELKAGKEPECTVPHSPSSKGVVISTSCDKTVRVTDTHLMATTKGFQLAYSLKAGDVLFGDYGKDLCTVKSVEKEKITQQYFGLNCVHSEVLASGLRASTFGDFHTLPSWYMTYVGGMVGSTYASSLGEYIAEWYLQK